MGLLDCQDLMDFYDPVLLVHTVKCGVCTGDMKPVDLPATGKIQFFLIAATATKRVLLKSFEGAFDNPPGLFRYGADECIGSIVDLYIKGQSLISERGTYSESGQLSQIFTSSSSRAFFTRSIISRRRSS